MKVCIVTQSIDNADPILAPFMIWFRKIKQHVQSCSIICLKKGKNDIEDEMPVYSLGKEKRQSKLMYIFGFYVYVFNLLRKKDVDVFFVHMNNIYIFLLIPIRWFFRKKIVWWYAHGTATWSVRLARHFVDAIVTSSKTGYKVNTPKRHVLGQGIDTEKFAFNTSFTNDTITLLYVGRISPVKHLEVLIESIHVLVNKNRLDKIQCRIVGEAPSGAREYQENLKKLVRKYGLNANVNFVGSVDRENIAKEYARADIFVNPSNTGSLDKTVLEAMSSGTYVINSNYGYKTILEPYPYAQIEQGNPDRLAEAVVAIFNMSSDERKKYMIAMREEVIKNHNVDILIEKILSIMQKTTT